jgi:hypothetical protein
LYSRSSDRILLVLPHVWVHIYNQEYILDIMYVDVEQKSLVFLQIFFGSETISSFGICFAEIIGKCKKARFPVHLPLEELSI